MNLGLLKNWRILLVIASVAISLLLIGPSLQSGALVTSVPSGSVFAGKVSAGELITWANEQVISSASDLAKYRDYTGNFL